jgi:hypothetical protein
MYVASDNMHRSTNGGGTWTNDSYTTATNYIEQQHKTGIALAVSSTNENKVYVSTSPFAQNTTSDFLWVNGQPNIFKTTTPATFPYSSIKGTLPDRFVMDFAISPTNDDSVFIVLGGFGSSHVYVTGNGGSSWTDIGTGLPDVPFNAILIDKVNPQVLYAGSDLGVFVSPDRGVTWLDYNSGFWDATLVMDLQMTADNKIVAATHGKGVFKSDRYSGTGVRGVTTTTFTGYHSDGLNKLEWTSQNESDMDHYELERSLDGNHFTGIANFAASNQNQTYSYEYADAVSPQANTTYYYRVKLVNAGGSAHYTQTIALEVLAKKTIAVLTNPFNQQIQVNINLTDNESISMSLYNSMGQFVRKQMYTGIAGSNILSIAQLGNLSNGIYVLDILINKQRYSYRLLKN